MNDMEQEEEESKSQVLVTEKSDGSEYEGKWNGQARDKERENCQERRGVVLGLNCNLSLAAFYRIRIPELGERSLSRVRGQHLFCFEFARLLKREITGPGYVPLLSSRKQQELERGFSLFPFLLSRTEKKKKENKNEKTRARVSEQCVQIL